MFRTMLCSNPLRNYDFRGLFFQQQGTWPEKIWQGPNVSIGRSWPKSRSFDPRLFFRKILHFLVAYNDFDCHLYNLILHRQACNCQIFTSFIVTSMLLNNLKWHNELIQSIKTIINGVVVLAVTLCIRGRRPLKRSVPVDGFVMTSSP